MEKELGPVFSQLPEPLLLLDGKMKIRAANPAAQLLLGGTGEELAGRPIGDFLVGFTDPLRKGQKPKRLLTEVLLGNAALCREELVLKKAGNHPGLPVEVSVGRMEAEGLPGGRGLMLVLRDATENCRKLRHLERQANTDPLTGLGNRRQMEEYARRIMAGAKRHGEVISLVILDMDDLKLINDSYGHHMGDLALKAVGEVLRGSMRASDMAARIGGDEFLLLLPRVRCAQAEKLVRRLLAKLAVKKLPFPSPVNLSYGIEELAPDSSWEETFRRADANLYERRAREGVRGTPKKSRSQSGV